MLSEEYDKHAFLLSHANLSENERITFHRKTPEMDVVEAKNALRQLSNYLSRYYGKKVIILLDEYDTPMQETFLNGYWEEMSGFINGLLNAAFICRIIWLYRKRSFRGINGIRPGAAL